MNITLNVCLKQFVVSESTKAGIMHTCFPSVIYCHQEIKNVGIIFEFNKIRRFCVANEQLEVNNTSAFI